MSFLKKFQTILAYIGASGLSFVVDLAAFSIILFFLNSHSASAIIIASYLARAISSIFNYIINKKFVFKYDKNNKKKDNTFIKYFVLVVINITISGTVVAKLYKMFRLNETLIKVFIDGAIFIINFFIQKFIIFKKEDNSNNITKYILPIISFLAIFSHLNKYGLTFNYEWYEYLQMIVSLVILYVLYLKVFKEDREIKSINVLSVIFTICMILGYSYNVYNSPALIYISEIHILVMLLKSLGYFFLIKNVLNTIYIFITEHKFKESGSKIAKKFREHPFLYSFITLSVVYGFWLIFFYPGVINYDNANQIKEVLGLHTRYLDSIVLLNDKVTLTNFNPVVHTLILGNFFKLGLHLGSANLGIFMYTIFQEIIIITALAYSISFLAKEGIKTRYLLIILGLYILVPYYPTYAFTAVKDSLSTAFVLLYIIKMYQYLKYDYKFKDYFIFFMIIILLILFRNNSIFLILMSLPVAIFVKKKTWKNTVILLALIIAFMFLYNNTLTFFDIPNTSIREVLSIPFQQTARYVKEHNDEVTSEEKEAIDKILGYDTLAQRYVPTLSDKVKNEYNKYATAEELKNYFIVWGKMFFKHPFAYLNATINNNYSYFYPNVYSGYVYTGLNEKLPEAGYDYHFNKLAIGREALKGYANGWRYIPVVQLLVSCGFYTWAYVFLTLLLCKRKKKNLIIILTPAISMIIMCFLGPANTYFRYVLAYAATFPLVAALVIKEINSSILIKTNNKASKI